jgi:hypothetical protein
MDQPHGPLGSITRSLLRLLAHHPHQQGDRS